MGVLSYEIKKRILDSKCKKIVVSNYFLKKQKGYDLDEGRNEFFETESAPGLFIWNA